MGQGTMPEFSARAFQDQSPGRDVPQRDAGFDVSIEPPAGHISEGQRRRAHHADFAHARDQGVENGQILVQALLGFGKADGHDGFRQNLPAAGVNDFPIQARRSTAQSRPKLVAKRIIDHADLSDEFAPVRRSCKAMETQACGMP
jgi:hypothetical protein